MLVKLLVVFLTAVSLMIDGGIVVGSLVVGSDDLKTLAILVLLRYLLIFSLAVHFASTHTDNLLRLVDAPPRRRRLPRRPLLLGAAFIRQLIPN